MKHKNLEKPDNYKLREQIVKANVAFDFSYWLFIAASAALIIFKRIEIVPFCIFFASLFTIFFISQKQDKIRLEIRELKK